MAFSIIQAANRSNNKNNDTLLVGGKSPKRNRVYQKVTHICYECRVEKTLDSRRWRCLPGEGRDSLHRCCDSCAMGALKRRVRDILSLQEGTKDARSSDREQSSVVRKIGGATRLGVDISSTLRTRTCAGCGIEKTLSFRRWYRLPGENRNSQKRRCDSCYWRARKQAAGLSVQKGTKDDHDGGISASIRQLGQLE